MDTVYVIDLLLMRKNQFKLQLLLPALRFIIQLSGADVLFLIGRSNPR